MHKGCKHSFCTDCDANNPDCDANKVYLTSDCDANKGILSYYVGYALGAQRVCSFTKVVTNLLAWLPGDEFG